MLATLGYGDAIGHEVLGIQRVLRGAGYESEIFVDTADHRLESLTRDYHELVDFSDRDNLLLHHFSLGSKASRTAFALPDRMALIYHNITPPEYFVGVHRQLARQCFRGRRELRAYADRCDLALGDSQFNREDLDSLGFPRTGVLPVVPDFSHLDVEPNRFVADQFDDEWTNIVFVGRVIANKKIDDLIRFFHAYHTIFNPRSRLLIVGAYSGYERYLASLHQLIATLGVPHVHFIGHVSDEELVAYYDVADLFLCASEHEGFCVPLIEAFYKQVPVLAYAATAVPATMDGGGVLYEEKDPIHVAALMDAILSDPDLQDRIVEGQLAAVDRLQSKDFAGTLLRFVDQILSAPRLGAPRVAFDFWHQFDETQALEELRLYRPACTRRCPSAMIVNQWVPAAHKGDAIGDSALRVRDLLRAMGHASDLYALTIDDDLVDDVRPFSDPAARRGDLTIFHFALPSPMTAAFAALDHGRVLQYHNVTPAAYFAPYDPALFRLASLGRQELATLVGRVDLALGDSAYNRQELDALGFAPTGVLPLAVDTSRVTRTTTRPALDRILDDDFVNFLFVGRIAPNKKIEDHIRLAEHYKRYVDAYYRFIFVGRYDVVPRYYSMIRALMSEYRLLNDRFIFTGPIPDEELAVYYRHAAVYISLSEHEGFCAPLVEAMAADVPVLAYAAAAVPETLGGAGVQFAPKDLEYAAELLGALAFDDDLRAKVIAGQRRRLADFGDDRITRQLETIIGGADSPREARLMKIARSSSSGTEPRCSAAPSISAGSWPNAWRRSTTSTC